MNHDKLHVNSLFAANRIVRVLVIQIMDLCTHQVFVTANHISENVSNENYVYRDTCKNICGKVKVKQSLYDSESSRRSSLPDF